MGLSIGTERVRRQQNGAEHWNCICSMDPSRAYSSAGMILATEESIGKNGLENRMTKPMLVDVLDPSVSTCSLSQRNDL